LQHKVSIIPGHESESRLGDIAAYGRKILIMAVSMEKSAFPELVSSRDYYCNYALFIKRELIMISMVAGWAAKVW
jgi:hypothetical protein